MTKADELTLLDTMIAKFGPNSYLGPWLAANRDTIAADIKSDFSVGIQTPANWRAFVTTQMTNANEYAKGARETALAEAEKIKNAAHEYASGVRKDAAERLRKAARDIYS